MPSHDVLCAGFPCQPFSKSGAQLGRRDRTRGTLFDFVLKIARKHHPQLILLENVGNFARHDDGNTWRVVRDSLEGLGYEVHGTEHMHAGGSGLLSPHHFGFPQVRERFFAVASLRGFHQHPLPLRTPPSRTPATLQSIIQANSSLSDQDRQECALTPLQESCIELWNEFLGSLPDSVLLPSFPIWSDEFGASYPTDRYIGSQRTDVLRAALPLDPLVDVLSRAQLIELFPAYSRNGEGSVPPWKARFIEQNRGFYSSIRRHLRHGWLDDIRAFPPSLRKLEWNCQGEVRDLWQHVLQFRPSGLRAKRFTSIPALVAMTTTQVPILGPQRRFLSRLEAKRLQAMPDSLRLPDSRAEAFRALGNAVHVGTVQLVYAAAHSALRRKRATSGNSAAFVR